jgi:hypothetical protein
MNLFHAWATHREDPVSAAIRSDITAERHVVDTAHDYRSAVARGNTAEAAAAKAKLRQAWETDVRRKGGHPEDFIPNYPNYDPLPVQTSFFFGDTEKGIINARSITLGIVAYILWVAIK